MILLFLAWVGILAFNRLAVVYGACLTLDDFHVGRRDQFGTTARNGNQSGLHGRTRRRAG